MSVESEPGSSDRSSSTLLVVGAVTAGVLVVGALVFSLLPHEKSVGASQIIGAAPAAGVAEVHVEGTKLGGPFTLVDQHGQTVTEAALAHAPAALFFGYTSCPDVCPTTLASMTRWLHKLGDKGEALHVFFISVDPERDSPEKLAQYLSAFRAPITGLTGGRDEVDKIIKSYGIYAKRVPSTDGKSYTMDHTAGVLLIDRNGDFQGTIDFGADDDTAVAALSKLLTTR